MAPRSELKGPPNFSVEVTREGGRLTIATAGELDLENVDRYCGVIEEAERSDATEIVIDLTELEYIDSSGLAAVLVAGRRSDLDGHRLFVKAGHGEVRRLLELTALDQTLNLID
jgi:anti-sigma B factor antagonist